MHAAYLGAWRRPLPAAKQGPFQVGGCLGCMAFEMLEAPQFVTVEGAHTNMTQIPVAEVYLRGLLSWTQVPAPRNRDLQL